MSLERFTGTFVVTCDFCLVGELDTEEDEFLVAVKAMQAQGWLVFKDKGEWCHKCPGCQGASEDDFEDVS